MTATSAAVTPPTALHAKVLLSPYERLCNWLLVWHPLLWRSRPLEALLLSAMTGLLAWWAAGNIPPGTASAWTTAKVDAARWMFTMATVFAQCALLFLQTRHPVGELRWSRQLRLAAFNLLGLGLIAWPFLHFDALLTRRVGTMLSPAEAAAIASHIDDDVKALCLPDTPEDRRRALAAGITEDLNRFRLNPAPADPEKVYRWAARQAVTGCDRLDSPLISRFDSPVSSAIVLMKSRLEAIQREQARLAALLPSPPALCLLALSLFATALGLGSRATLSRLKVRYRMRWPRLKPWPGFVQHRERHLLVEQPLAWALGETRLYAGAFAVSAALCAAISTWSKADLDSTLFWLLLFAMFIACPSLIVRLSRFRPALHGWQAQLRVASAACITLLSASVPLLITHFLADNLTASFLGFMCAAAAYCFAMFITAVMLGSALPGAAAVCVWLAGSLTSFFLFYTVLAQKESASPWQWLLLTLWPALALLTGVASRMERRWRLLTPLATLLTTSGAAVTPGIAVFISYRLEMADGTTALICLLGTLMAVMAMLYAFVWRALERSIYDPR